VKRTPQVGSILLFWVPPLKQFRPGIVTRTFENAGSPGFPRRQIGKEGMEFFVSVPGPFVNGIVLHDVADMAKGMQPMGACSLATKEPEGGPLNPIWTNEASWWKWPESEVDVVDLADFGVN
jgi:hypothetical protein